MLKKSLGFGLILVAAASGLFGCSTAPRRAEVRPVEVQAPPQSVPAIDPAEMERLKQELNDQQAALARSEADKRELEDKLNDALASKKTPVKKTEDSYLK